MFLELTVHLFLLVSMDMVRIVNAHVIPKGFHLSNSCQPRCQSGQTCVVYRGTDGNAQVTCKSIDPHKVVLDGTFIISTPNPGKIIKDKSQANPTTVNELNIVNLEEMIKTLPDISADKLSTREENNLKQRDLIIRMKTLPESIKDNTKVIFRSDDRRPQLFDPDTFAKNVDNFPPFQKPPSTLKSKTQGRKHSKLEGLILVRNADGGVVFRRRGDIPNQRPANHDMKVEVAPLQSSNDPVKSSLNTSDTSNNNSKPSQMIIAPENLQNSIPNDSTNVACKPCDPDKKCPGEQYCFYSSACAAQICQALN